MKFTVGDKLDYMYYVDLEVIGVDSDSYILRTTSGSIIKVYKFILDCYAKLSS